MNATPPPATPPPATPPVDALPADAPPLDAVVVGAGLAGLYQLYRLRELGLRTRVFEAGGDVGGTWYWNRYPGARCDIESMSYSFSFSPELDQEWVWSEKYATQPEILRYIHHVADRFALRGDITLNTRATRAVYDEERHLWQLSTDTGESVTTRFLVMASGCSSTVKDPGIPGADSFAGLLSAIPRSYTDILVNEEANETVAAFIRSKIGAVVDDPRTAERLSPRGFPFGTKRPCLDTGYYATYNKPQVTLVDLRETPIEEITPKGVRTADGREHLLDVIVHATGFDAITGSLLAPDIVGKGGVTLREKWADGPVNQLGLVSAGFPNLFTVTGPLSPSVLTNMVVSIEQHVEWITDCVAHLRSNGITEIDATPEAEAAWTAHVAELASGTLYPAADSWYLGANVPGKPRVFLAYVGGADRHREACAASARNGYTGFTLSGPPA
ncbi:NAD(P)/FAD-dependent oxidoreductase [Streptomyces anulatus]|uniref:flavin-containing monooxygenase n=1 Tax=Streptomyces anulatus TaxID=1892 RepID=UPI0038705EF1